MKDQRIEIWNVLHDGEIAAISDDGGTLMMFVNIPYLRRRLTPLGDSFVLTLSRLTLLEFYSSDGTKTSLREELDIGTPAILSTDSASMPAMIETTMGRLILDFQRITFALDIGQAIEYEAIVKVGEEYWAEWKEERDSSTS
jgi:hypothetical protein